jgi:hypothetical protein
MAFLMRTPSDLRPVLEVTDGSKWLDIVRWNPELEPQVREALRTIFDGIWDYYRAGTREALHAYLDSISGPLAFLRKGQVRILGLVVSGKDIGAPGFILTPDWILFFIGVEGMYLRLDDPQTGATIVHSLSESCEVLHRSILAVLRQEVPVTTWESYDDVEGALGHPIPFCKTCCLTESFQSPNP